MSLKDHSGWPTGALEMLSKAKLKYLTKYEEALFCADIAHGYFIYGKDNDAIAQAKRAACGGICRSLLDGRHCRMA